MRGIFHRTAENVRVLDWSYDNCQTNSPAEVHNYSFCTLVFRLEEFASCTTTWLNLLSGTKVAMALGVSLPIAWGSARLYR